MKNLAVALIFAVPAVLFARTFYLILSAPTVDWYASQAQIDAAIALRHHLYLYAAYTITWAIQLSYLAWLATKWRAQQRRAADLHADLGS